MDRRRDVNLGLAVVAAAAVGFAIALLLFRDDNKGSNTNAAVTTTTGTTAAGGTATTQTSTGTGTAPATATTPQPTQPTQQATAPTTASCIDLWNQPTNRGAQTFLVNVASQQPVRVNVGTTSGEPPKCLVTVVANNGDAYVYSEGGGTTFPYAPAPARVAGSTLPADQKTENALEQRDGTLKAR
jgi:hypothetical protein